MAILKLKKKEQKTEALRQKETAQQWVGIKDIKDGIVYFKDGAILQAIRVYPISINLMTEKEQEIIIEKLARKINTISGDFFQASTFKNVDMQIYIKNIENKIKKEKNEIKKKILRNKIRYATEISMLDDYSEVLYYVLVREEKSDNKALAKLRDKTIKLAKIYSSFKMQTTILKDDELEFMYKLYNRKSNIVYDNKIKKTQGNISLIPTDIDNDEVLMEIYEGEQDHEDK